MRLLHMRLLHTLAMVGAPCLLLIGASLESGWHTNPPVTPENTIQENLAVPPARFERRYNQKQAGRANHGESM